MQNFLRKLNLAILLFVVVVLLYLAGNAAFAAMAVQDNAALAKWSEQIKAMKEELAVVQETLDLATEQLEVINDISKAAKETVDAIGEMTQITLPFPNLVKLTDQIVNDAFCLIPDWEDMLPDVRFKDLNWNSICEAKNAYKQVLFYEELKEGAKEKAGDAIGGVAEDVLGSDILDRIEDDKGRARTRQTRQIIAQDVAVKGMAQSDAGRKAAEDLAASADELFGSAKSAKSMNERLAVQNQASVAQLKGIAQTNLLLSQLLRLQTIFLVTTLPAEYVKEVTGGQ